MATPIASMNWLLLVPANRLDPVPQLWVLALVDSFSLRLWSTIELSTSTGQDILCRRHIVIV